MIDYLVGVAKAHAVNPLLFVLIYMVSTVPFLLVSGWLVHHIRKKRPLAQLVFLWGLCYTAPYIYVLAVGRDLPLWVYAMVALLIVGGLTLAARGLMRRLRGEDWPAP
jgi:sulfite exporter TauE/SafE